MRQPPLVLLESKSTKRRIMEIGKSSHPCHPERSASVVELRSSTRHSRVGSRVSNHLCEAQTSLSLRENFTWALPKLHCGATSPIHLTPDRAYRIIDISHANAYIANPARDLYRRGCHSPERNPANRLKSYLLAPFIPLSNLTRLRRILCLKHIARHTAFAVMLHTAPAVMLHIACGFSAHIAWHTVSYGMLHIAHRRCLIRLTAE